MSELVPPHGSDTLKPLLLEASERLEAEAQLGQLKIVPMSSREVSDLLMLGMGAYTPLDGFMGHDDWRGVCADMRLASGLFWPIPITLSCSAELADSIAVGETVALADDETRSILGTLEVSDKYSIEARFECEHVYRTTDEAHPGVQKVMGQGRSTSQGVCRSSRKLIIRVPTRTCTSTRPNRGRCSWNGDGRGWLPFKPAIPCIVVTSI